MNLDQTTALLTLPFKEDRDSRHNYRTAEEKAIYKNRESTRDAFLYQLRAFLNARGKLVNAIQSNREILKIQQSSRVVVDGLRDSNLSWFSELFCDLLLQIGLVPLQETDKDLLNIADKDKLQKLHKRFSSNASQTDKSSRKLTAEPGKDSYGSSPKASAQQFFPGHQEFFFMFIVSSDSYLFGLNLRAKLISKIAELKSTATPQNAEKKLLELCLIAKFLGLLTFSPNWSTWNATTIESNSQQALDGLLQLSAAGLSVMEDLKESLKNKSLVLTVPWVVELLKMSKWDRRIKYSRLYMQVLVFLRQLQTQLCSTASNDSIVGTNQQLVCQSLEFLFGETVGLLQAASLSLVPMYTTAHDANPDSRCFDTFEIATTSSTLFAMNQHIDELSALISKLCRSASKQLRTLGASRKLRPSIVGPSTPSIVALQCFIFKSCVEMSHSCTCHI